LPLLIQPQKIEKKTDTDSQGNGFPEYVESDASVQTRDQSFSVFLKHFFDPKNLGKVWIVWFSTVISTNFAKFWKKNFGQIFNITKLENKTLDGIQIKNRTKFQTTSKRDHSNFSLKKCIKERDPAAI
jgi:hypothetical protein